MEWQTIINIILGVILSGIGWFAREIWDTVKHMRTEIRELDIKMHQDFVRRDDFKEAVSELKSDMRVGFDNVNQTLMLLNEKLDRKSDK